MSRATDVAAARPSYLRQLATQSWHAFHPVPALYCLPAVLALLAAGLLLNQPGAAMVMASGAFSAGFGAFQRVTRAQVGPMLMASLLMALAMALGTAVAGHLAMDAICVGLAALALALGQGFGTGLWWVLLQGAIFLIVAGAQPGDLQEGLSRAGLILAGGLVQSLSVTLLRRLLPKPFPPLTSPTFVAPPATPTEWREARSRVLRAGSPEMRHGLLLGLAAAAAVVVQHRFGLGNGYWAPMTVILVLRPGDRETAVRGVLRMAGTLLGAGLATLVVALVRPAPAELIGLIALSAWGAYALQWVNYGTFSTSVTSYIAFLFALEGLPEPEVAGRRIVATLIGGLIAFAVLGAIRLLRTLRAA